MWLYCDWNEAKYHTLEFPKDILRVDGDALHIDKHPLEAYELARCVSDLVAKGNDLVGSVDELDRQ